MTARMMLQCPVCGALLTETERAFACANRHSFDRSRYGYVNLLQRQTKKLRGDDAEMVRARRDFLDGGYYQPLLDAILAEVSEESKPVRRIADIGCGEGWYSCNLLRKLTADGNSAVLSGFDISPDALRYACVRSREAGLDAQTVWAVSSVNRLPLPDESADLALNLFAPCFPSEFARILRQGGLLLRAVPLQCHLWELKTALYDAPYENRPVLEAPEGFSLEKLREIRFRFTVQGDALTHLFAMTPYAHKTAAVDIKKLYQIDGLTVQAEFGLLCCRKQ